MERDKIAWRIERERAYETSWWRELRAWFARRRFSGRDWITIPDQRDPAMVIAEPLVRLHADGLYRVTADLEAEIRAFDAERQEFVNGLRDGRTVADATDATERPTTDEAASGRVGGASVRGGPRPRATPR